jgi:hypothetical protein
VIWFKRVQPAVISEPHGSPDTVYAARFSARKFFLCVRAVKLLCDLATTSLRFHWEKVSMLSDGPKRLDKTWEQLVAAASMETDPEKLATIMEEIFAALEERERTLNLPQNPSTF